MTFTLKCPCGFAGAFGDSVTAEGVANSHATCGSGHTVTCTRPAHGAVNGVPVIVFITNISRTPHTTRYESKMERYPLAWRHQ